MADARLLQSGPPETRAARGGRRERRLAREQETNDRASNSADLGLIVTDAVEKVFLGGWTKFFRASSASDARRREGLHRLITRRPQCFLHVPAKLAASEMVENRFLRDFAS